MAANDTFGWVASDGNKLVNPSYEYYRKNRWIMDFAGLPVGIDDTDKKQVLRLNCKTASRPERSFADTKVERINGSINLPGKPEFADLTIVFYDNLSGEITDGQSADTGTGYSVSDIMEQWSELIYKPTQGDAFGSAANFKAFARLHLLRPQDLEPTPREETPESDGLSVNDSIEQSWVYQGLYPKTIKYGDLDYASSDVAEVTVTFKYDRAFRIAPVAIDA